MKDLDDDIKHVLYDMLVLAQSMRYMTTGISDDTANSMFGFKETALNAAATKVRSLLHFAFDSRKPADKKEKAAREDDIIAEDFVKHSKCSAVKPDAALKGRFPSYDKYVAHITRTRTTRAVPQPKARKILADGKAVLAICKPLIEECFAKGVSREGRTGRYYAALNEEMNRK